MKKKCTGGRIAMEKKFFKRYPLGNPTRFWRQDRFIISTFSIGGATENIRLSLETLKAANFNLVEFGWLQSKYCDPVIATAEEVGVDVLVQNFEYFGGFQYSRATQPDPQALAAYIEKLKKYRHVYGFYIWDEPYKPQDLVYAALQTNQIEALDPSRMPFTVAIPSYNDTYTYANGQFDDYLTRFVEQINPPVMSLDFYPFATHPNNFTQLDNCNVYKDLYLMRKLAAGKQMPLWFYYQGTPNLSDPNGMGCTLTPWQMDEQVGLALLYGAKGIQNFTAVGAVVNPDGTPADYFDHTKKINSRLTNWGRTLMALTSTGVFHSDDVLREDPDFRARYCDDFAESALFAGELGVRISAGEFIDEYGHRYFMVLNRDYCKKQTAKLTFRSAQRVYEVSDADGSQALFCDMTDGLEIDLKPGQARLFRAQYPAEAAYTVDYILSKD